ncbi:uncharacterized protein PADG_12422 [Paracoccidioides brasiliensis Pb18]|uniref:Uncharacterized protein n=1 Tax=Paracoccidioides brasiliensis (strain Pb18) TaxID=502780 RepID=A0A0A0HVM6_PARBD|nr:uncharacterized protein PADG_12422 [Paracoccidioides brasiliensis Pb18]KGM91490.1 hypothetical protein PADG_12422 [Paracoccidioides brasiliensis Pb18]
MLATDVALTMYVEGCSRRLTSKWTGRSRNIREAFKRRSSAALSPKQTKCGCILLVSNTLAGLRNSPDMLDAPSLVSGCGKLVSFSHGNFTIVVCGPPKAV